MRFEDEQYVKVYRRDTATWKAMTWQARAIWPLILRKVDGAGLMDTSALGRVEAVAALIDMPLDVVEPGLASLAKLGCLQWLPGDVLLAPKFVEAQEARKTEALKKRDQREQARAIARAQELGITTDVSPGVPECPAPSPVVPICPDLSPSRSTPSSSPSPSSSPVCRSENPSDQDDQQGDLLGDGEQPQSRPKKRKRDREPDPRHHPLKLRLMAIFLEKRGAEMAWDATEAACLTRLMARGSDDEICRRLALALDAVGFHRCNSIAGLSNADHWNNFAGQGAPSLAAVPQLRTLSEQERKELYR